MAGSEEGMNLEEDLVLRCARGEAAAYRELVERIEKPLVNFILRFVGERHVAEDLFQEVCVIAVQKAAEFQDGTSFIAWARTIARNKLREQLRRRSGVNVDDAFFDGLESAFDAVRDPDVRKDALRRCLGEIQERTRQMLVWRYEEGLSAASIAERTGDQELLALAVHAEGHMLVRAGRERRTAEARA